MKLGRLRQGEWMALVAGVVLLVVLFLPWFESQTFCGSVLPGGTGYGPVIHCDPLSLNAWDAFSITDIVLAAAAIAGILAAVLTAANSKPDAPITWEASGLILTFIAAVLAVYRLIDPPSGLDRDYGVWIGTAAALVLLWGNWRAERDEYGSA